MIKIAEALWSSEPSRTSRLCSQAGVEYAVGGLPVVEAAGAGGRGTLGLFTLAAPPCAPTMSPPSTATATSTPATRPMVAYMLSAISGLFAKPAWRS